MLGPILLILSVVFFSSVIPVFSFMRTTAYYCELACFGRGFLSHS